MFKEGREPLQDNERMKAVLYTMTERQTVNLKFYNEVIKRLKSRVHSVRPEVQESGS